MAPPAATIIEGRLYYCSVRHNQPPTGEGSHWFSIDDALVYWNFFLDFGADSARFPNFSELQVASTPSTRPHESLRVS